MKSHENLVKIFMTHELSQNHIQSHEMLMKTVMDGSEAGVDLVLIQTLLLYYVNHVILLLTSIFEGQFP